MPGEYLGPKAQWPWEPPGLGLREKSVNLFLNHPHHPLTKFSFWGVNSTFFLLIDFS